MQFVDVLIRQAHPGSGMHAYQNLDQKLDDARTYRQDEAITWPVLVDDLEGTVHQTYGGLGDPTYLIDVDGRVAYYNMWTHVPTLHRAIMALREAGGRGVVLRGIDHVPHMAAAMTDGWKGLRRGLPQSFTDLMKAAPGAATGVWLGYKLRLLLKPLTLRATPLPRIARVAMAVGALAIAGAITVRIVRRYQRGRC